jgi:hypothetical protein
MAGRVNMPGALALGDLATTTAVSLGRSAALVVDNSGTGAAGQVSVTGALSLPGGLDAGSNPVTCGALSAGSIAVDGGGRIRCDAGSASAPALSFGADSTTGLYSSGATTLSFASNGSESMRVGATAVSSFVPLSTNGNTFLCDTVTCGSLSCASISAAGTFSGGAMTCGALSSGAVAAAGIVGCAAVTCGALSCASAASTGAIAQPRYSIRVYKNANQLTASGTITSVVWDAVETGGGGATNWTFTPGATLFTCPKAGRYLIIYQLVYAVSGVSVRDVWVEINPPGGVPGSVRRRAEVSLGASGSDPWVCSDSFTYQLGVGDTILVVAFQGSGGNLNLGFVGNQVSECSITRLNE